MAPLLREARVIFIGCPVCTVLQPLRLVVARGVEVELWGFSF